MKEEILKATGLSEQEFYKKYPTIESFVKDYPEYKYLLNKGKSDEELFLDENESVLPTYKVHTGHGRRGMELLNLSEKEAQNIAKKVKFWEEDYPNPKDKQGYTTLEDGTSVYVRKKANGQVLVYKDVLKENPVDFKSINQTSQLPSQLFQEQSNIEPNFTTNYATFQNTENNENKQNLDELSFKEAFALARQNGLKTFKWRGKLYGTKLASEKTPIENNYIKPYQNQYALGGFMNPEALNQDTISVGTDAKHIQKQFANKMVLAGLASMAQMIPFIGGAIKSPDMSFTDALGQQGNKIKSTFSTVSDIANVGRQLGETAISAFTGGALKAPNPNINLENTAKEAAAAAVKGVDFSGDKKENRYGGRLYKKGGVLTNIDFGSKHEFGGVEINDKAEVEKGETILDGGFVFSDSIINPSTERTFAQDSKVINKKFTANGLRNNDPLTKEALKIELGRLAKTQEDLKEEMELMKQTEIFDLGGLLDPNPNKTNYNKLFRTHNKILKSENWKDSMLNYLSPKLQGLPENLLPKSDYDIADAYFYHLNEDFQSKPRLQRKINEQRNQFLYNIFGGNSLGQKAQQELDRITITNRKDLEDTAREMSRITEGVQHQIQEGILEPVNPLDNRYNLMRKNQQAIPVQRHHNEYRLGGNFDINPSTLITIQKLMTGLKDNPEILTRPESNLHTKSYVGPNSGNSLSTSNTDQNFKLGDKTLNNGLTDVKVKDLTASKLNPLGYIGSAASILGKAVLNATQKGPALARTVALQRFNVNPQLKALTKAYDEQLASQLYSLKENSPTVGNYLTNATLAAAKGFADKGVNAANIIGAGAEKNVAIANDEEVRNQAIQYQNALANEQFRDQRIQNWDTTFDSAGNLLNVLGKDIAANKTQNFIINNLIKTGNLKWGKDGLYIKHVNEKGEVDWKPYTGIDLIGIQSLLLNQDPYMSAQEQNAMLNWLKQLYQMSNPKN